MIGILPFFHIYGMTVLVNLALWRGATVVTMPRFELDAFLRLMQDHRVTYACLVPSDRARPREAPRRGSTSIFRRSSS